MKKLFTPPLMTMLFCCIGAFFITSCDDDDEKGPVNIAHPFQSVTAVDGSTTATAVISDDDKTITFPEFQELTDLSNVEVTFNLTPGAFLKTPAKPTARVNLTTAYTVEVNTGGYLPVAYTMTAKPKDIPNPILSAKVGMWRLRWRATSFRLHTLRAWTSTPWSSTLRWLPARASNPRRIKRSTWSLPTEPWSLRTVVWIIRLSYGLRGIRTRF